MDAGINYRPLCFWSIFCGELISTFLSDCCFAGSKSCRGYRFYYAANAVGRLAGTFLSGFLYHQGGLLVCLAGSALFLLSQRSWSHGFLDWQSKLIEFTPQTVMLRLWPSKTLSSQQPGPWSVAREPSISAVGSWLHHHDGVRFYHLHITSRSPNFAHNQKCKYIRILQSHKSFASFDC